MAIRKGSTVRSIKVGARKSFVGKVIEVHNKPRWYHVADKDGRLWHRTLRELRPVTQKVKP